ARVRRDGSLLAAAVQVGLGAAAVDLGAAYAGERTQFGKVIGGFQAVKHLLADAQVAVEVARAAVHAAAVEIDEAEGEAPAPMRPVDGARVVASHAAERATTACIQVHGGIGYTWELDAHLFLKRSMVLDVAFTPVEAATESLAAAL
ncbi:MAG: acyl-CoA dehydrogenase family protein, partial [Actinomycetota bacterium]